MWVSRDDDDDGGNDDDNENKQNNLENQKQTKTNKTQNPKYLLKLVMPYADGRTTIQTLLTIGKVSQTSATTPYLNILSLLPPLDRIALTLRHLEFEHHSQLNPGDLRKT